MAEFNLIPERYILWRKFMSDLRTYLLFMMLLLCFAIAGLVILQSDIKDLSNSISVLHKTKAYLDKQHTEIRDLLDSKSILETRFKLVRGLKGRITTTELFLAMDDALSDEIEFESWSFQRIGQPAKQNQVGGSSSYFLIVDEVGANGSGVDGVHIRAEMNLTAKARSHSAMAEFMKKLSAQFIVNRVELVRSGSNSSAGKDAVEFELLVSLFSDLKPS